eukprot:14263862-Alexandrium_andersonii.AAC.1
MGAEAFALVDDVHVVSPPSGSPEHRGQLVRPLVGPGEEVEASRRPLRAGGLRQPRLWGARGLHLAQ